MRCVRREIALAQGMDESEIYSYAKQLQVPFDLLKQTAQMGRLPVVNFAAGGIGKIAKTFSFPGMLQLRFCGMHHLLACIIFLPCLFCSGWVFSIFFF